MKSTLWILPLALLSGCSAIKPINYSEPVSSAVVQPATIHNIADVNYLTLDTDPEKQHVSDVNGSIQQITLASGTTPVIGYQLPDTAPYTVEIASLVSRTSNTGSLFYPEVRVLDHNYQTLQRLTVDDAHYQKRRFLTPENVNVRLQVNKGDKARYLLVYTTDQLRQEKTTLFNEAKAYAKAKGQTDSPVPDIEARHINQGKLQVRLAPSRQDAIRAQQSTGVDNKPTVALTTTQLVRKTDQNVDRMIDEAVQQIRAELEKGNVGHAIKLRQQAIVTASQAEETFINGYNQNPETLKLPVAANSALATEQARHYFNSGIIRALKSGDNNQALLLVDEAKRFANGMDRAFQDSRVR